MFSRNKIKIISISIIIILSSLFAYISHDSYKKKIHKIDSNIKYKVIKVVDGDTFDISINNQTVKVRLLGVDTPETVDPRKTVQCFGKEASDKAKELLIGHFVTLKTDPTQSITDKYDRLLVYVYRDDGLFINKYLVENGYAHEYTYNIPYQKMDEFKGLERWARDNKVGLWGNLCG